jgi:hypothetical protein
VDFCVFWQTYTISLLHTIYCDYFMHHVPTRAELLAALDDPNPGNPLAVAIAETLAGYAKQLADQAKRAGAWPNPVVLPAPATELEVFALELFTEEIRGAGIRIAFAKTSTQ